MLSKLARNSVSNLLYRILVIISTIVSTPILLNNLGIEKFGLISFLFILTINGYYSLLDSGFSGAITKFVAEYQAKNDSEGVNNIFNTTLLLFLFLALISSSSILLFGSAIVHWFFKFDNDLLWVLEVNLYLIAFLNIIDFIGLSFTSLLQGLQRYDLIRKNQFFKTMLFLLLIIIFNYNANLKLEYGWLVALICGNLISYLLMLRDIKKNYNQIMMKLIFQKSLFWKIIKYSMKIFSLSITGLLYNNFAKTILAAFSSMAAISFLEIGNKVKRFGEITFKISSTIMVPASAELFASNNILKLRKLYLKSTLLIGSFSITTVLIIILNMEYILDVWLNTEVATYSSAISLYIGFLLFYPLVPIGWNMMIGTGDIKNLIRINILTVIFIIILALALVPKFGFYGIGLSILIGNLISTIFYVKMFNNYFKVSLKEYLISVILKISLFVMVILFLYWLNLFLLHSQGVFKLLFILLIFIISISLQFGINLTKSEKKELIQGIFK